MIRIKKHSYLIVLILLFSLSAFSLVSTMKIFALYERVPEYSRHYPREVAPAKDSTSLQTAPAPAETAEQKKEAPAPSRRRQKINAVPEFKFDGISSNETFKGEVKIAGKVDGASGVELYLMPENSSIYKYIGKARSRNGDSWAFTFDSKSFPNGSFYLVASIRNAYGTYSSDKLRVNISNQADPVETKETETQGSASSTKTDAPTQKTDTPIASSNQPSSSSQNTQAASSSSQSAPSPTGSQTQPSPASQSASSRAETPSSSQGTAPESVKKDESAKTGYNGSTSSEWQSKYFKNSICQDKGRCGGDADPDKDNLTNDEEFRLRTDPLNPDSDGDGYLDGDEVKNGFDPNKYSSGDKSDKVTYENPKKTGAVKKDTYRVKNVELDKKENGESNIRISGKGLPNSFVNIYVYSSNPIILTVKTDADGNWSYELDKELANGNHEVYVAVTDNTGKITAKSEPLAFVKTAQAIEVIPNVEASGRKGSPASPAENRLDRDMIILAIITFISFIAAIVILGSSIAGMKRNNG